MDRARPRYPTTRLDHLTCGGADLSTATPQGFLATVPPLIFGLGFCTREPMTIRAALIFNNYGNPRVTKFYSPLSTDRQQALIQLIFQLVSRRDDSAVCNFLDAPELTPLLPPQAADAWSKIPATDAQGNPIGALSQDTPTAKDEDGQDPWIHYPSANSTKAAKTVKRWRPDDELRVIYRHYATLYFVLVVDQSESELGILDLIQVIVEALDRCFENVCELDLIFHYDQVCPGWHPY